MKKFLLLSLFTFSLSCHAASNFSLEETTISAIQNAIQAHQITCTQLTDAYLDRIKKYDLSVDKTAPINAFTEINPSILEEARALDQRFQKTQKLVGPLHCIPVVIKDNIDAKDLSTTSGSLALLGTQPIHDATLVKQLRHAGAIILGKGTMDEFAWGMLGISSRSGRTGNAYDPNQNPGGSSGGPAAAVSANFAVIGIGTDNSGSVRIPAAFNGLVGLRPTMGLISQQGIFPMGNLDGTAGPMTRTVEDLAKTLEVIAAPHSQPYSRFLQKNGLQGKRIGVVHQVADEDVYKSMPNEIHFLIQQALNTFQQGGAIIIDPVNLPAFDNNRDFNQAGEIEDVNHYLASFPATRQNFQDICLSDRTRTFGSIKECLAFIKKTPSKSSHEYQQVLAMFKKNRNYAEQMMAKQHLDALLIPISTSGSATYEGYRINTWLAPIASNAGLPSLEMGIGADPKNQLPVGIEIVAKPFDEGTLIEIAYADEQMKSSRTAPRMPNENVTLEKFDIPRLNHLFTLIGSCAYEKILKNSPHDKENKADILTPAAFQQIVKDKIQASQY